MKEELAKVEAAWNVTAVLDTEETRIVEAEAGTGSRYVVVTAKVHEDWRRVLGGPIVVSVIQPWQVAWCLHWHDTVHIDYVRERFTPGRPVSDRDVAALTMTIADAVDGRYVL